MVLWNQAEHAFLTMGQPRPLFHLFLLFRTIKLSSLQDSNSDWRSRRQARWPLDHHYIPHGILAQLQHYNGLLIWVTELELKTWHWRSLFPAGFKPRSLESTAYGSTTWETAPLRHYPCSWKPLKVVSKIARSYRFDCSWEKNQH